VSSWGFLKGLTESIENNKSLFCCNINRSPNVNPLERIAKENGINFKFYECSDLDIEIEPVDIVFIDTLHVYGQLKRELKKFAPLAKKYIMMHDTEVDGIYGETIRMSLDIDKLLETTGMPLPELTTGLQRAVNEFLVENTDFKIERIYSNNNGLTILKRIDSKENIPKLLRASYGIEDKYLDVNIFDLIEKS